MARKADFGGILGESFAILKDNARDAGLFVLVIGGFTALGVLGGLTETASMVVSMGFMVEPREGLMGSLFDLALSIVSLVAGYMLLKRFLASRGRLRGDANRFWHYLGMVILAVIGLVIGFILLVVPGLILLARWSAASGFVIGAQEGVAGSLKASWNATRGHGWAIFFAGLVMLIAIAIVVGLVGSVFAAISLTLSGFVTAFLEAAVNAVSLAFAIAVYVLVQDRTSEVEEVFA